MSLDAHSLRMALQCGGETIRPDQMTAFGRYEVIEEVGRGGMGVVYKALDPKLGREVALKVLLIGDPDHARKRRRRFEREAKLLAGLRHPAIPAVHDFGEEASLLYLVCDFLEGETLDKAVNRGRPLRECVGALIEVSRALHYAHGKGILHRDVKPSNIFLGEERTYLVDFGLAKDLEEETGATNLTRAGQVVGTLSYAAPEQVQPEEFGQVGPRTDVRALGATLFYCLTGRPPFRGATAYEVIGQLIQREPSLPSVYAKQTPPELDRICAHALRLQPAERPASAAALADLLEGWLQKARSDPLVAEERTTDRLKAVAFSEVFEVGTGGAEAPDATISSDADELMDPLSKDSVDGGGGGRDATKTSARARPASPGESVLRRAARGELATDDAADARRSFFGGPSVARPKDLAAAPAKQKAAEAKPKPKKKAAAKAKAKAGVKPKPKAKAKAEAKAKAKAKPRPPPKPSPDPEPEQDAGPDLELAAALGVIDAPGSTLTSPSTSRIPGASVGASVGAKHDRVRLPEGQPDVPLPPPVAAAGSGPPARAPRQPDRRLPGVPQTPIAPSSARLRRAAVAEEKRRLRPALFITLLVVVLGAGGVIGWTQWLTSGDDGREVLQRARRKKDVGGNLDEVIVLYQQALRLGVKEASAAREELEAVELVRNAAYAALSGRAMAVTSLVDYAVDGEDTALRIKALNVLAQVGDEAVPGRIGPLIDDETLPQPLRDAALAAAASSKGPDAVPWLGRGIARELVTDRDATIERLLGASDERAVGALIDLLALKARLEEGQRAAVCERLGSFGDPRAAEVLCRAADGDASESVRVAAIEAIAKAAPAEGTRSLLNGLRDRSSACYDTALEAFDRAGERCLDQLERALLEQGEPLAALALCRVRTKLGAAVLARALRRGSWKLRGEVLLSVVSAAYPRDLIDEAVREVIEKAAAAEGVDAPQRLELRPLLEAARYFEMNDARSTLLAILLHREVEVQEGRVQRLTGRELVLTAEATLGAVRVELANRTTRLIRVAFYQAEGGEVKKGFRLTPGTLTWAELPPGTYHVIIEEAVSEGENAARALRAGKVKLAGGQRGKLHFDP